VVLPDTKEFPIQPFDQIQSVSLKDACIAKIEGLILSGGLAPGERLPSERDLAVSLGVSRPVLHQAIVALDAKGLVRIEPRHGVFVCDFRRDGSMALLMTLMQHEDGVYQPQLLTSLIQARLHGSHAPHRGGSDRISIPAGRTSEPLPEQHPGAGGI